MVIRSILTALMLAVPSMQARVSTIINENDFQSAVGKHNRVLVKFSADWCSVCNGIQKPFEEISDEDEFQGVMFAQVDVDKLDGVSKQNGIVGVPTFGYYEKGNKKVEEIGVQNMPAFKEHLRDNLRKNFDEEQMMEAPAQEVDAVVIEEDISAAPAQAAPQAAEPNFFVKIFITIKNFFLAVLSKIKDFFMTIVNAIKGFFG